MTLEELRMKYQTLADNCEKRGNESCAKAEELTQANKPELAKYFYDKANSEYNTATMYMHFANELSNVTK